jgi:uncharacterized protein (DUF2336 family)
MAAGARFLTIADVTHLLEDPSPEARAATAGKVAQQFTRGDLSARERKITEDIFRILLRDAEVKVRIALAEHVKDAKALPRDIAVTLARDVDPVAVPVLEHSTVLTDDDLIEIVRAFGTLKQRAIARRRVVSHAVAAALVETGDEDVVNDLISNAGADISEKSLQKVLDTLGDRERLHAPLVARPRLPLRVAERLVTLVAAHLQEQLVMHHELSPGTASDIIMASRERAIIGLLSPDVAITDVVDLVRQLSRSGRLTPSIIMRALCSGDTRFFEAAMAVLAGVPLANAQALIYDAGRLGLKGIFDKAGLPAALFPAVRVAVDVAREAQYDAGSHDRERFTRRVIERILTQYDDLGADNLDYLLGKLSKLAQSIGPRVPHL